MKTRSFFSQFARAALALTVSAAMVSALAVTCLPGWPPSNPDAAYTVNGDGTATDTRNGLMWKVCSEGQTWSAGGCTGIATAATWADALAAAETSTFAGYSDWRLPNVNELESLVEECRVNPSINDSIFPATPSWVFWSGSPEAVSSTSAWVVSFYAGDVGSNFRGNNFQVRLVRGADGACGSANGIAVAAAPSSNLCAAGNSTAVTGTNPFAWSCAGIAGGSTASCSAPLLTYTVTASAGTNGAISPAVPQTVTGGTTQTFTVTPSPGYSASVGSEASACGGSLVGSTYTTNPVTSNCTVTATFTQNPINGSCGSANGVAVAVAPSSNLCAAGNSSAVTGSNPFIWTCAGIAGGSATSCSAPLLTYTVTASAGANGTISPAVPQTVVSGNTTAFTITPSAGYSISIGSEVGACGGSLSGTTYTTNPVTANCTVIASFTQMPINGSCGTANGVAVAAAPSSNLCAAGNSTAVTGTNPFVWSCTGISGGSTASCSASLSSVNITVNKIGNGTGVVTGSAGGINCGSACSVARGSTITFTATPNAGHRFVAWTVVTLTAPKAASDTDFAKAIISGCTTDPTCTIAADGSTLVTAEFQLIELVFIAPPVPTLGQWALILLGFMMLGVALMRIRREPMRR